MPLTAAELTKYYGRPKSFEPVQVQSRLPWTPRRQNGSVQVVLAHPLIADRFVEACHAAKAASAWTPKRIDSYVPRPIRNYKTKKGWQLGDRGTSRHSWAVAFDFFATPADVPPPGGVWTPDNPVPPEFAKAFTDRGWTWGRNWKRRDDPHLEYSKAPGPSQNLGDEGFVDFLSGMLKQGDAGRDVWDLQYMLRAVGQNVEPNGIFDSQTHGAVIAVQTVVGLKVDGLVGTKTEAAISDALFAMHGDAAGIVRAAYLDVFGREPDVQGSKYWTGRVASGLLIPDLWANLWTSDEAVRRRERATAPSPTPDPVPVPAPEHDPAVFRGIREHAEEIITLIDRA